MTTKVLLHKDKHMRVAKEDKSKQPVQLELWKMMVSQNYSNSVELYQTLPDVFSWKQIKLRNPDGSLPVLTRQGNYNWISYILDISPANITVEDADKKKQKKAFYKTVIAEFVEYALHKLSISEGFFLNDDDVKTEEFWLITTFYRIREELKNMGKNYSYDQIKDGITILAWLRYQLSWDISKNYGLDSFFSPIDLTIKNDRKNPLHSELYITFNKLVSKKILALDWRWFNYSEFMKVKTSFGRSLFMRLSYRFKQVDVINGYHFLLSTLIDDWVLQEDLITTNIKKINEWLKDCGYIIEKYTAEKKYSINPQTKRRALTNYKVTVFPTKAFRDEQYRFNVHNKNIQEHKIDQKGKPVIKPMADQYKTKHDFKRYLKDKENFDTAKNPNN